MKINTVKVIKNQKKYLECPVSYALEIIGGKWSLLVIKEIGIGQRRFGEIKRLIPEISEKMLIQELKKLVKFGIINRKAFKEIPPKVEYSLTEDGKKVLPVIQKIKEFGIEIVNKNTN